MTGVAAQAMGHATGRAPAAITVGLLAFLAYASIAIASGAVFENGRPDLEFPLHLDVNSHVCLSYAFVSKGTADIADCSTLPGFGFESIERPPHRYSPYLPGLALLFAPFALAAGALGQGPDSFIGNLLVTRIAAATFAGSSVAFMYLALGSVAPTRIALYLTFAYAFGTSILSIASQYLFEHPASVALVALALLLLVRGSSATVGVAGLALGLAVLVRPMNAFVAVAVLAYVAHRRRERLATFVSWSLGPAVFLALYDALAFGSPLAVPRALAGQSFGAPLVPNLVGLLVSPSRGLLIFSPFLALAVAALGWAWPGEADDTRWLLRYSSLAVLANFLFFASYALWWGGDSYGPRYLTDVLPILTLALGDAWRRGWLASSVARAAFAAALGWSVLVHAVGAAVFISRDFTWGRSPSIDDDPGIVWRWDDPQWGAALTLALLAPRLATIVAATVLLCYVALLAVLAGPRPPRPSTA